MNYFIHLILTTILCARCDSNPHVIGKKCDIYRDPMACLHHQSLGGETKCAINSSLVPELLTPSMRQIG